MRIGIVIGNTNIIFGLFDCAIITFIICGFCFGGLWIGLTCLGISLIVGLFIIGVAHGGMDFILYCLSIPAFAGLWYLYELGYLGQFRPLW